MLEDKVSDSPPLSNCINGARKSWTLKDGRPDPTSSESNAVEPAPRVSLLSEHCIPPPAPGPLTGPFVGGLPGNSLLIGGRTAPLQLAQFKAQLALTHISNVLAVGVRAPALTSSSKTHKPHASTAPPSPTAVAINLLNVLKIVNAMSHPLYNPYASGKQSSSQGQYGVPSGQTDPRLTSPHLRPGSNFSPSGASSVNLGSSVGPMPSLLNLPTNYRPEKRGTLDEDIERSVNLHISQAREGVKHQHPNQRSCFPGATRNELPSSVAGGTSYLSPSSFQGQRLSNIGSTSSTLDWLPTYNKVNQDNSKVFPSASSGFAVSGGGRFNSSSEERRDMQSIPGLGDFEDAMESKSTPPPELSQPKYTSESAISILMNFGLEKEDLQHLISYPESQITPENLPFILREIRIKKAKSAPAVGLPEHYPEPQPNASRSRVDKLGDSRGSEMNLECVSASILKPSKVIDYGHTGKYNAGVEVGKVGDGSAGSNTSAGMLRMDTNSGGSHSQDLQLRTLTEVKVNTSSAAPCREPIGSSSISSVRSSLAPSSSTPTPVAPIQPSQYMFNMFNFPKKDTDMRQLNPDASEPLPVKLPEPSRPMTVTTQPPNTLTRGVHPQRPGLVVFDSKKNPAPKCPPPNNPSKTLQPKQLMDQMQHPKPMQPQHRTFSAVKPFPPAPVKPGGVPAPAPPPHQQIPTLVKGVPLTPAASMPQSKMEACKGQPSEAMIRDYAAATPKVFPHTCSLCKKESAHLKDWISHHNTTLHLENCRLLRTVFPKCGGEVLQAPSPASKDPKPSPSTSAQTSQSQYQKSRWSSPSPSRSPRRQRRSEDRRNRRGSRSRSRSPRRRYSSDNRSDKHSSRSNSRSPHRRSESRRERRSRSRSPRSRHNRRSRTRSRSNSPRYSRYTSSRYRSRSRSRERRSPPRRKDEKRSPRRSRERRSSAERRRSSSTERLAKKLLETTAAQSLSKHSDLEAMVKTLAPALLAELAKIKSSSSSSSAPTSSSSTSATKKESAAKATKGKSSSSGKHEGKSSPPTMVKLMGVTKIISHGDVASAIASIGKTKSVVIFRSKLEAVVCFEKEEDAEKLRNMKVLDVKGIQIFVVAEKESVAKETKEQNPPEHKSASSSDGTAQTTKSAGKEKEPAAASKSKKPTTAKPAAKAKVTVCKVTAASTGNAANTGAAKTTEAKKDAPEPSGPKKTKVQAKTQTGDAKPTAVQKKTGKVTKTPTKASASKTAAADAKVSAKTAQTPKPASQSSAGAEKTMEETPKTETSQPQAAGSPSGEAQTLKSGTASTENPKSKPAARPDQKEAAELHKVQIQVINNPVEVKQEPMEVKGFGTLPPKTTDESTHDEPPKPDASSTQNPGRGSTEIHQSPDPPKGIETEPPHESSAEAKVDPTQTDAEDALFVGKTQKNGSKAVGGTSAASSKAAKATPTPETTAGRPEIKADPTAAAGVPQTEAVKVEQQQEDGSHVKNTSKRSPSKHSDEHKRCPRVKAAASAPPATSAEPAATPKVAKDAEKPPAQGSVRSSKEKKDRKKEATPKTTSAAAAAAAAATCSLVSEDDIPKIDENMYKAFTAVLREHKLSQGAKTQSDDKKNKSSENKGEKRQKKVEVGGTEGGLSSSFFDEQNFNLDDFVTLDEIVEDVDDTDAEQTSTDKTEKKSKEEPSAAKKASCKSSSTSSSKSTTSSSKSALTQNQKDSSESSLPSIKTSPTSSSQASKPSPSPSGRTTRSSSTARKSEETSQKQKVETRAGKSAVTKSDHSVSAESSAVKTVESELSKRQMQSQRTDFKDETKDDGEHMAEMRDYGNPDVQKDVSHPSNNEAPIPEDLRVSETIKMENTTETDAAIQVQGLAENQTSEADDGNDRPEQALLPEGKGTQDVGESEKPTAGNEMVLDNKEANQTPSSIEGEGKVKQTEAETKTNEEQPVDPVDADTFKEVETLSHQQAQTKDEATEEEDEVYHVIDAIEDLPTTTESETDNNEEQRQTVSTCGQEDDPTRKSGQKSKISSDEKEESPKKRDRKAPKTETQLKKKSIGRDEEMEEDIEDDPENMIFEVLDSVEDESFLKVSTFEMLDQKTQTGATEEKTSSEQGSPKSYKKEEDPEKDEQSVSTRSTRGRKVLKQDQAKKEDTPSRRSTPARDSRGPKEKVPKTEDDAPLKESTPTEKSGDGTKDTSEEDAASNALGAPEEESVQKDQPPVQEKPRRGRPKKNTRKAKKQVVAPKKVASLVKESEEDEDEFQIIDSVEEEAVEGPAFMNPTISTGTPSSNDQKTKLETTKGLLLNEEEEPLYQILDSVDDDALQEEVTPTKEYNVEVEEDAKEKSSIKTADSTTFSSEYQKCQLQSAENVKEGVDGSSTDLGEDTTQKIGAPTEEEPPSSSQSGNAASADVATENDMSKNALKNLDEVSEEEEDYPDDTAEEEELNKRLAAAKAREERRTQDGEDRERKSRSHSRGRSQEEEEEKVDLETQELVTLDEVGGDEAGEPDFEGLDSAVMEGELQDLVTLDEINEEEVEEGKESQTHETRPRIQDGQSEDLIRPETSAEQSTITDEQKSPGAAKRKHDEDAEESSNCRVVDDLGKNEEEEKMVTTRRSRGRPKKKSRQTVRKSARGKESSTEDEKKDEELESLPSTSLDSTADAETSGPFGDDKTEIQKPEEDTSLSDVHSASGVQQLQPEPDDEKGSVMKNERDQLMTELKGNKRHQDLIGPESKRARSESPSVPASFLLPPYNPKSPIGQEHVVPKSGFFCNICSIFYLTEKAAKEVHCSSQKHYENLQKHYKKLQRKSSRTQSSQGSVSD